jgi:hypothetical protein
MSSTSEQNVPTTNNGQVNKFVLQVNPKDTYKMTISNKNKLTFKI